MATARSRTKLRRAGPLDAWSTKERLCLASSVLRNGDKNWSVVSQSLQEFLESNRPPDWFSPEKCELHYIALLEGCQLPKRKKRGVKKEDHLRTIRENIVRKLTEDRVEELQNMMHEEQQAYLKMKTEVESLKECDDEAELQEMAAEKEIPPPVPRPQEKKDKHVFKVPAMVTKHRQPARGTSLLNPYTSVRSTAPSAVGSADSLIKESTSADHASIEQQKIVPVRPGNIGNFKIPPSSLPSTSRVFRATKSPLLTRLLQTTQSPPPQPSKPLNIITQVPTTRVSQNILCVLNGVPTLITGHKSNILQNQQQQQQQLLFSTIGTNAENRPKIQTSIVPAGNPAVSRMLHIPQTLPTGPLQTVPFSSRPPQLLYIPVAPSVANFVAPKLNAGGTLQVHGQHLVSGLQNLPKNEKFFGLMPIQPPDKSGSLKLCPVELILGNKNILPSSQVTPSFCGPSPSASRFIIHTAPETNLLNESLVPPLNLPDDSEISEPFLDLNEEMDILQENTRLF